MISGNNDNVVYNYTEKLNLSKNTSIDAITAHVQGLRLHGFNFTRNDDNKIDFLIADHSKNPKPPIHEHEHEIQALRYLKGIFLFAENYGNGETALDIKSEAADIYKDKNNTTHQKAEKFAELIKTRLGVSIEAARKQVTMARDLGILLENHPGIRTISKNGDQVTEETSRNAKISNEYYDTEFTNVGIQPWFKAAKKYAGFSENANQKTWLEKFFDNNLEKLKEHGVPASPSSRWLPLPANVQDVSITTYTRHMDDDGKEQRANELTTSFVRMGSTTAFDIKDVEVQKELATNILVEILRTRIKEGINQYREKYNYDKESRIDFFVNYQTLLSPHYFEAYFYPLHKDNNAKFIEMAKEAMQKAEAKLADEMQNYNVDLVYYQTNSAINKMAGLPSIKQFDDSTARNEKLNAVADLIGRTDAPENSKRLAEYIRGNRPVPGVIQLDKDINEFASISLLNDKALIPETKNEIILRIKAAVHLRLLLNRKPPYNDLPTYQHNIMQGSLELLAQGSQDVKLLGCKSARDRTAVLAAAIKTMQENPRSMDNWDVLNKGIIVSLEQGHHFRSMSYHVAMVKIDDVHSDLMEQLDDSTQKGIKATKKFFKPLEAPEAPETSESIWNFIKNYFKGEKSNKNEKQIVNPENSSTTNIIKELETQENIAIEKITDFQHQLYEKKWEVDIGGKPLTYHHAEKSPKEDKIVPTTVDAMLIEIQTANNRGQTFRKAWEHMATRIATAQVDTGFFTNLFRSKTTHDFYNEGLEKLGIDPIASLKKIEDVIDTTKWQVRGFQWLIGDKPHHIQVILNKIKWFNEASPNLPDARKTAYKILNDILALAAKTAASDSADNNVLRRTETQAFYENITQHLVAHPKPKEEKQIIIDI